MSPMAPPCNSSRSLAAISVYNSTWQTANRLPCFLTQAMIALVAVLSILNVWLLGYVVVFVGGKVLAGDKLPVMVGAGLVFFAFLDWLLVVWFWDPGYLYGIGWQNSTSMLFMILMYGLAAAIYFGFSAYRKSQGIDVDKVYKEIPVE